MALAPADFYAYSQATGVPVPETPEERASLAPEVMSFRRNQLKAPQEERGGGDALAFGLGIGLGLAGLAGGAVAARRLLQTGKATGKSGVQKTDLSSYSKDVLQRVSGAGDAVPPSKPVADLVDIQQKQAPLVTDQQTTSVNSGQQQSIDPIETAAQRDTDSVKFGVQQAEQEQVQRNLSDFEKLSQRATGIKRNIVAAQNFLENDYSEGLLSELMEQAGLGQVQSSTPKFTAADLTGRLGEVPGFDPSKQKGKERLFKADVFDVQPIQGPSTGAGEDLGFGIAGTKTIKQRLGKQTQVSEGGRRIGMSELEIADRISAAANYEPGSEINQLLLNPNVPTQDVAEYLGSSLKIRGGRVGTNLISEVAPGARASMTGTPSPNEIKDRFAAATLYEPGSQERAVLENLQIPVEDVSHLMGKKRPLGPLPTGKTMGVDIDYDPSYEGSDVNAYNTRTGNTEFDFLTEELDEGTVRRFSDYETNASDYGDVEGPGGLVESYTYGERTKSGTTQIPGQAELTTGIRPGSERQERVADVQMPTRATEEGDIARGYYIDEETGQLRMTGTGQRIRGQIQSSDVNVEGSKQVGGYQLPVGITEAVPVGGNVWVEAEEGRYGNTLKLKQRPGTDAPRTLSQGLESDVIRVQPYMVDRVEKSFNVQTGQMEDRLVKRPLYGSLVDDNLKPVSISRSYLTELAKEGQNSFYNNPQAVKNYLQLADPDVANAVYVEGTLSLDNAIKPYHKTGFIAEYMDQQLRNPNQQMNLGLPVLRDPSAKHRFVSDVLNTSKEGAVYGKPIGGVYKGKPYPLKGSEAEPIVTPQKITRLNPATGQMETKVVAGPTKTDVRGFGGIDPMTLETEGSELAANVGYQTPRISTAPRREIQRYTQSVALNPLQLEMQQLRTAMETAPVGYKVRSPGSFARTQNPYTAAAAPAMGPVSRVNQGSYQYPEQQLSFRTQPVSQRALQERNQFAYTANLTPGGRVVPGAQILPGNMGTIQAGIGPLTESETVQRYGATGRQLQQFGNRLMAQAAYRRGMQPGFTNRG